MGCEYYTVKDIQIMTGLSEVKIMDIIKILNDEIESKYDGYSIKPLLFKDKIEKTYFMKRVDIV